MMKHIILILLALFVVAGTAASTIPAIEEDNYAIIVLVWSNETGALEENVKVTFGGTHTLTTAGDGSVVFNTANIPGTADRSSISVSCKYGTKQAPIIYTTRGERNWGTAVTFNEPSEYDAMTILAAMGFAAVALGGGRYLLRKKNTGDTDTMTDETTTTPTEEKPTGSKLMRDFGVRALFGTITLLGYIVITTIAVLSGTGEMVGTITNWYMPLIMAIVGFYFGGSTAIRK